MTSKKKIEKVNFTIGTAVATQQPNPRKTKYSPTQHMAAPASTCSAPGTLIDQTSTREKASQKKSDRSPMPTHHGWIKEHTLQSGLPSIEVPGADEHLLVLNLACVGCWTAFGPIENATFSVWSYVRLRKKRQSIASPRTATRVK